MKKFIVLAISLLCALLVACGDNTDEGEETQDPTTMWLRVDVAGDGVPAIETQLTFYDNEADWMTGSSPILTGEVDSEGVFKSTDPVFVEGETYYVDAERSDKNNWLNPPNHTMVEASQHNEKSIQIDDTLRHHFAGDDGTRTWELTDIQSNGTSTWDSVDDCNKDDTLVTRKNFTILVRGGDNLCDAQQAEVETTFLNPQQATVTNFPDQIADPYRFQMSGWPLMDDNAGIAAIDARDGQTLVIRMQTDTATINRIYTVRQ